MEPGDAILEHEPTNRRWEISPRDLSFLSSFSIIHGFIDFQEGIGGNRSVI